MKRKIFLIFLALSFIGMMGWLISKEMTPPEVYEIVKPEKRTIQKKTVANGSVVPRFEIMIKPTVSGIITELMVEAGDVVKKGDVLAKIQIVPDMISLSSSESRVRQARISVENAQLNFDRNKPLFDKGVIAQAEMDQFRLALNNAQEDQRGAEDNLSVVREGISKSSGSSSNTLVRSTIDGMVLDVPVEKGNSVIERNNFNEGTTIASVADMKDLIFEGNLDESEVGKVRLGMPIVLTIGAIDDAKWDAEVEYIAMYSTSASHFASSIAPMVNTIGIPKRTLPTSLSSRLPSNIKSFISATDAIVVPSLKLFRSITLLPFSTGTSNTIPSMVLRTNVLLLLPLLLLMPSRTTLRLSSAPR